MNTVNIQLPSGRSCIVLIERKRMKTCRLKVFPDSSVILSLPEAASDEWAASFLQDKSTWLEKKLDGFKKTVGYAATNEIRTGYSITLLGQDFVFSVVQAENSKVLLDGKIIYVYSTDVNDQGALQALFQRWWRKQALEELIQRVDHWYPIIEKYGISKPRVYVRRMKTLWGSCSAERGTVTFNLFLIKAKEACIDYVVLHELTHFLYPNHSKLFYAFLSNYMPDWKERKRILDQDVVHGL